jgi:hypothetical protein
MYEIIKKQFDSGKTILQPKYYGSVKRELWAKFHMDLYPLAQDYYHELNPLFLYNMYNPNFYKFSRTITVRDGYLTFATFLLNNLSHFPNLGTELFLIPPSLAPLVPPNLASSFACWQIVQPQQIALKDARKVIIWGYICDQYVGDMEDLAVRIKALQDIDADATVELYIPIRRNVFETKDRETITIHQVMDLIKDILPHRKIKILRSEDFFGISDFRNTYIYDLVLDNFIVSDNYLHYFVQSRGGTVNNDCLKKAPTDTIFNLDLSFHHQLHVTPLPTGKNIFMDILMYKKQNPMVKDLTYEPTFQNLLRDSLKKES